MFEPLLMKALWTVLIISGIPVVVAMVAGLIVSIIQAATQVQEQSISYVVKVGTVVGVLVVFAPWFSQEICEFFRISMRQITALGAMP